MQQRRAVALYAAFLLAFFVVVCRLYVLATNQTYASRAQSQTVTTLELSSARGDFYDHTGQKLTGAQTVYYALCIPGEESYVRLFDWVDLGTQSYLYQKRNAAVPFLVPVDRDLTDQGVYTYQATERYAANAVCVHLLGYLNDAGEGVTGLEAAFDELLRGSEQSKSYVQCVTNGQGRLMDETEPILYAAADEPQGVQLTLSKTVQRACEGIAAAALDSGCILVLDTATAKVRACVSYPFYDPENVAKSIAADDGSLVNRAFSAYNVGSVFKPVLAAAALEENLAWLSIECKGWVDLNGQIYRCAGGVAHGPVDLQTALEKSCNCYFIELGSRLGATRLLEYAGAFGFGQPTYLAGGLKSAAGNLPSVETLQNLGQRANFSFGQGQLLATPLQLAAMMNAIAADGVYRTPSFLQAIVQAGEDGTGLQTVQELYDPASRTVLSAANAQTLRTMLCAVVEQGTGSAAQPQHGTAAGKTGTAQTGRYDEAGEEYKDLWFVGFYPAQQPQYTVVVMQDDQTEPAYSSAEVFAKVCDALYWLEQPQQAANADEAASAPAADGAAKTPFLAQNS